ncbi:hypothetical protein A6U87_20695 [Rhizobium sp. AC44/96]|nr:hypothetical protein A6U87_20695 [Rhizobium sp. AC44/96]
MVVTHVSSDRDPWPSMRDETKTTRQFVRFGVASMRGCDSLLVQRWRPDQDSREPDLVDNDRFTFAGSFAVSGKNAAEKGSLVVSRFLFDLATATESSTITFTEYTNLLEGEFKNRLKTRAKPLAIAEALADQAFIALKLPPDLRPSVKCVVVSRSKPVKEGKKARKIRDARLFGNAYPGLLRQLRQDVEDCLVIGGAWDLLTQPSAESDFDAGCDDTVLERLETHRYPSARWPSDFSLSPYQQVAVNELFARTSREGIFSINGPPGTGKTTLVMDVVAEIISRRAEILLRFDNPLDAFKATASGSDHGSTFEIDSALHDFIIAVASSNNGAVNNLTLELPKRSKIGERYGKQLNYLPKLAERILAQHQVTSPAWGSVSVPLGNKQNRDRCASAVAELIDDGCPDDDDLSTRNWGEACAIYRAAKARVDDLKAKHVRLDELARSADEFGSLQKAAGARPPVVTASSARNGSLAMSQAEAMEAASHPIIAASQRQIEEAREELGKVVLPAEFLDADPRARAEMLVGTSTALEDARADLFVAAMALHQSFIAGAWDPISANLRAWTERIAHPETGGSPSSAVHLWSTFSLLVPVVSSTFCSFANVFASLGRDAIPWLIVDEAGQAAAHHAIDALSRAKRTIVIGDPFQLEPISAISSSVDDALASRFGIPREFRSKAGSLQTLADRINPFGARRNGKWIGAPLLVHRRCIEPMFSISNALAYEHSMVLVNNALQAENPVGNDRLAFGPESAWFNVRGASEMPDRFYVPEEGALACYIMSRLAECRPPQHRGQLPDLFVISPFRKVALGIREDLLANAPTMFGHTAPDVVEEWAERSIGTVHSFQGKEAEIVLLVLGASDAESISWALAKPNIMNVAVTRARRRLYVIGNRANWFQDSSRDAWMLGQGRDWLVDEADARALFSRSPHHKPHLRLVV